MNQQIEFRALLLKIQDLLTENDRQRLHFLLGDDIPKTLRDDTSLGGTLRIIESLFQRAFIDDQDCDYLIEVLKRIECNDAVKCLQKYQQNQNKKENLSLENILLLKDNEDKMYSFNTNFNDSCGSLVSSCVNIPKGDNVHQSSLKIKIFNISLSLCEIILIVLLFIALLVISLMIIDRQKNCENITRMNQKFRINNNNAERNYTLEDLIDNFNRSEIENNLNSALYYRLTNNYNGPNMSLDIDIDTHNYRVKVSPISNNTSQFWFIVLSANQSYYIRNRILNNEFSLTLLDNTLFMGKTRQSSRQLWHFVLLSDGSFKLYNLLIGNTFFLDVYSDNNIVFMGTNLHDYTGQHWTFRKLKSILK